MIFMHKNTHNERQILEENLDQIEKYFHKLKGIPESLGEINLRKPAKKDLVGLCALYALKNPDDYITGSKLYKFAGLSDQRILNRLIDGVYGLDKKSIVPDFKGSKTGILLKDAGFMDSNLFYVAGKNIEIGRQDITRQIRLPYETDENVAWLSGVISVSNYFKTFLKSKDKEILGSEGYGMSFHQDDKDFTELEFEPVFNDVFNYVPHAYYELKHAKIGRKEFDAATFQYQIQMKSIVSFLKNEIGIAPKQEERGIVFEDKELKKAFVGGVIDRCGYYTYKNTIELHIPLKYPRLAEEVASFFGRNINRQKWFEIYFAGGSVIPEKIEEFGLRHPKWFLPEIEKLRN